MDEQDAPFYAQSVQFRSDAFLQFVILPLQLLEQYFETSDPFLVVVD